jgi:hypothetical protein
MQVECKCKSIFTFCQGQISRGNQSIAEFAPGASSPTNNIGTLYRETFTVDAVIGTAW